MSCVVKMTQLPAHTNEWDIRKILRDIGVVRHVEVFENDYAIVELGSAKKAREAAMRKHKLIIGSRQIRVKVVWSPRDNLSSIRVSNLAHGTSEETVTEIFSAHGEIINVRMDKCKGKGKGKGSWAAAVAFAKIDYACKACFRENGAVLPSAPCGLKVVLAHPDARNLKWRRNQNQFEYCALEARVQKESTRKEEEKRDGHEEEEEKYSQEKPTVDGCADDASTMSLPMSATDSFASPHAPAHVYFDLQSHNRKLNEIACLQEEMWRQIGLPIKVVGPFA